MFSLTSTVRYYLYLGATDMRKSFDGLYGLVKSELKRDPFSGEAFIFINKRMDRMKVLHWEAGGFVLYYKLLEQGTSEILAYNAEKRCRTLYLAQRCIIQNTRTKSNPTRRTASHYLEIEQVGSVVGRMVTLESTLPIGYLVGVKLILLSYFMNSFLFL